MKDRKTSKDDYWLTKLFLIRTFMLITFIFSAFLIAKLNDKDAGTWVPATVICAVSFLSYIYSFKSLFDS